MKKRVLILALLVAVMLTAVGCGKKTEEPVEPETPPAEEIVPVEKEEPIPEDPQEEEPVVEEPVEEPEEPEEPEPAFINPLTGLGIEESAVNRRPVAVMFNNLKAAQPQLGVSQADLIYEVPAEGGITRMLGVFQSLEDVGVLGSIRSTRAYYLELALGHDALLVHAGGSPEAYADIPAWGVDNMDGVNGGSDARIFWRDAERKKTAGYEHSLLTSGEKVQEYLDTGRFRTEHKESYSYTQAFAKDGTPENGTVAEHVEVRFSEYKTGIFDYDADTGLYMIGQYGKDYVDGNTGQQVGVTNLLVLETAISVIPGDTAGRLRVDLSGSGKGSYYCGGKTIPICWSKQDRNSQFVYTDENGEALAMGRGRTYICIISPKTSSVTVK